MIFDRFLTHFGSQNRFKNGPKWAQNRVQDGLFGIRAVKRRSWTDTPTVTPIHGASVGNWGALAMVREATSRARGDLIACLDEEWRGHDSNSRSFVIFFQLAIRIIRMHHQASSWSLLSGSAPWNNQSLERQIIMSEPMRTYQTLGSLRTMVKTCVENKACAVLEFCVVLACRWIKAGLF